MLATRSLDWLPLRRWPSINARQAEARHHCQGHHPRHHRLVGTNGARATSSLPRWAIRSLSAEARMTICNMSIKARCPLPAWSAPDQATFDYIKGQ